MATFYVLPPRPLLEESLVRFLDCWLPGLPAGAIPARELTEWLQARLDGRGDLFVLFREDLPEGVETLQSLRDAYGAEPGDEVVELRLAAAGEVSASVRRVGAVSVGERIPTIPSWTTHPPSAAYP